MRTCVLVIVLFSSLLLTACGPAAIVGAIGSAVTRTAYENDAKINDYSQPVSHNNSAEIAITNLQLGIGYMREGQYEKALEKLNRAKEAEPDYPPVYNALGVLHQSMGVYDVAEESFKTAIRLNPEDSSVLNNYGLLLCQTLRFEEADTIFIKAANNPLYTTPELAFNNAGACALDQGKTELAKTYLEAALKNNSRLGPALIQMSEITYEQGNYTSARDYLERYLALYQHTPKSLWLGIRVEEALGDKNAVSSYALLLRNQFSESEEAELLRQSALH